MSTNPRTICESIIHEIMAQGEAKGHGRNAWRYEPITMHLMKGARHAITAIGMIDHADFVKDNEDALQHIDQAIARLAFARAILTDLGDTNENQQDLFKQQVIDAQNAITKSQGTDECGDGSGTGNSARELSREYETCKNCGYPLGGEGGVCHCASI